MHLTKKFDPSISDHFVVGSSVGTLNKVSQRIQRKDSMNIFESRSQEEVEK